MKKSIKKYKIPIYFGTLIVLQDKDDKRIAKEYNLVGTEIMAACTFTSYSKDGHTEYIMAFFGKTSPSIIAHEAVHTVNGIFRDRGIQLDANNDEPQAYLLGWIVDKCHKTLKLN